MESWNRRIDTSLIVAVAVSVVLPAFVGCSSNDRLRPAYLSGDSRLVGGGLKVKWEAPEAGTVYLVEKQSGKLVETFTLKKGESYEFSVESVVEAEELQDLIGVSMSKAQFLLYFKPTDEQGPTPRTDEPAKG